MYLQRLPRSFNVSHEITPPFYTDHFLFAEELQQPYECPEFPAAIGLLVAAGGECQYRVNGTRYPVGDGQVFFVNRGSPLQVRVTGKAVMPALLFFHSRLPDLVQFSLSYGGEVLLEKPFDSLPFDFSYLERLHSDAALRQSVLSLIELGSSCSSFASLQADSQIRDMFESLLMRNQEAYKHSQNIQAVKASTRLEIFRRIAAARDWMEANYSGDINLEKIAAVAAMNSQHFLRMFKQVYSITPHQYLIDIKLRRAATLLESGEVTINEVCQAIGFESPFSFSVLFKRRFGVPPSQFRKV
ncbi:MAG TPA: AraC family transcriptional regulator [Puia sp.]|jgi:AraC-like DNA-binding protein|nr:AraC family transcriptional regulator [Puia sp.]